MFQKSHSIKPFFPSIPPFPSRSLPFLSSLSKASSLYFLSFHPSCICIRPFLTFFFSFLPSILSISFLCILSFLISTSFFSFSQIPTFLVMYLSFFSLLLSFLPFHPYTHSLLFILFSIPASFLPHFDPFL